MAELKSQISALLNLGADAMDNMFDVFLTLPKAVIGEDTADTEESNYNAYNLRCSGFDPPQFSLKTFDQPYKNTTIRRPSGKIEGNREFSLQFRLDANYSIYRNLMKWRDLFMQPSTAYAGNGIRDPIHPYDDPRSLDNRLGIVDVYALASPIYVKPTAPGSTSYSVHGVSEKTFLDANIDRLQWRFFEVWLSKLENPKFKTGGGEVQLVTATFGFGRFEDPRYTDVNYGTEERYGSIS